MSLREVSERVGAAMAWMDAAEAEAEIATMPTKTICPECGKREFVEWCCVRGCGYVDEEAYAAKKDREAYE